MTHGYDRRSGVVLLGIAACVWTTTYSDYVHGQTHRVRQAPPATSKTSTLQRGYKDRLLNELTRNVPNLLSTYSAENGHFGKGIWICRDQHLMYPLAVVYSHDTPGNSYYKDADLLEIIMKAGDALADDADERGQWVFRKKDGSTWGTIWMPWTYSRWVRTYMLIRDDMPPYRRAKWRTALTLGYTGISRERLRHVHNIPAHHAMGLYAAGKAMERPDWCKQASDFLLKVVKEQKDGGYWSENVGPVVNYNSVYIDALGTYYAMSGDKRVLDALDKAARFHYHFCYPNGERVETVDERNPYHPGVDVGNVGLTFTPHGRAFLGKQWALTDRALSSDLCASLVLYGHEGDATDTQVGKEQDLFALQENGVAKAAIVRRGPWFACLSAYTAVIPTSRWIQDRQNLVSIYHDKVGLILGGGNTKLQPAWSSFTVGDMALLRHTPGDTNPNFMPTGELYHVPKAATLIREPVAGLDLTYGPQACRIRVEPKDDRRLHYAVEVTGEPTLPVLAHLTLLPRMGESLRTAGGHECTIGEDPVNLSAQQVAGGITYAGYRLHLPKSASMHWPALPHNPYRKDGRAEASEGRIEVRIPFDRQITKHVITLEIMP